MRLIIHHKIGKKIFSELKDLDCYANKILFLLGNIFPDLNLSYLWRRHEYQHSREYTRKMIEMLKKRPWLFSFHLGILTHYICDYFCYPHSSSYDKGLVHHILYEVLQKAPKKVYRINLKITAFTIEELDRFVEWYEDFRTSFKNDESDFQVAAMVASNFLKVAY